MGISSPKWSFLKASVDNAEDLPGVYGLYDRNDVPIYYGMSEHSIRYRLQRHFRGEEGPCTQQAFYYR